MLRRRKDQCENIAYPVEWAKRGKAPHPWKIDTERPYVFEQWNPDSTACVGLGVTIERYRHVARRVRLANALLWFIECYDMEDQADRAAYVTLAVTCNDV